MNGPGKLVVLSTCQGCFFIVKVAVRKKGSRLRLILVYLKGTFIFRYHDLHWQMVHG